MKRAPGLQNLSSDHHRGLLLAFRVKKSVPGEEAAVWEEVEAAWAAELAPHFAVEEKWLLPALERAGEKALADRTRAEHEALRACLVPGARAGQLQRFASLLEAHIRFEERELFEVAQARLPAAELEAIGAIPTPSRPARPAG